MKTEFLVSLSALFLASPAFAGFGSHSVQCTIKGFDTTTVKLACDPSKPKDVMTTPKTLLPAGTVMKSGNQVSLTMTDENFATWLASNRAPASVKKGTK